MKPLLNIVISILLLVPTLAFAACDCGSTDQNAPCTGTSVNYSITNDGDTDTFAFAISSGGGAARCGQFADGSYWATPAVGQSSVVLTSLTTSDAGSLDENPHAEAYGAFDTGNAYGGYSAVENVLSDLPKTYSADISLLGAIKRNEGQDGNCRTGAIVGSCLNSSAYLTILMAVPSGAGSTVIRPNVDRTTKTLITTASFDTSILPNVPAFGTKTDAQYLAMVDRWNHSGGEVYTLGQIGTKASWSEGGRAFRSHLVIPNYAAEVQEEFVSDFLSMMNGQAFTSAKYKAFYSMMAYGQDMYFSAYNDSNTQIRYYLSGAGQWHGRYTAAVLFAAMQTDNTYSTALKKIAGFNDTTQQWGLYDGGPNELAQIHPGVNGPVWGDTTIKAETEDPEYWSKLYFNLMGWSSCYSTAVNPCVEALGPKTQKDFNGYIDGPPNEPGAKQDDGKVVSYLQVSSGPTLNLATLMYYIPRVNETVNYPLLITYANRLVDVGIQALPDPCAPPDPRDLALGAACSQNNTSGCNHLAWHTGVTASTKTWGPDPANNWACVTNTVATANGHPNAIGRFPDQHGRAVDWRYLADNVLGQYPTTRLQTIGGGSSSSVVSSSSVASSSSAPSPSNDGGSLFTTAAQVTTIKSRVTANTEPYKTSYDNLISTANGFLSDTPDYFYMADTSAAVFEWCNTNPTDPDNSYRDFVEEGTTDSNKARTLALAYLLTDTLSYSTKAKEFLLSWANNSSPPSIYDKNPNFVNATFTGMGGTYCDGDWSMALDSMWGTYALINFSDTYKILSDSGVLSGAEDTTIRDFIGGSLFKSVNGGLHAWVKWADANTGSSAYERYRKDNHLAWSIVGLASAAAALDNASMWAYAITGGSYNDGTGAYTNPSFYLNQLDLVIQNDGTNDGQIYDQPVRDNENKGLEYGLFHLQPLSWIAQIAEVYNGSNYWQHVPTSGETLLDALDYYAIYVNGTTSNPNPSETLNAGVYNYLYEPVFGNSYVTGTRATLYQSAIDNGSRTGINQHGIGPVSLMTGDMSEGVTTPTDPILKPKRMGFYGN